MNRVVQFSKLRYVGLIISVILLAGGISGTILRGGFNFGIDFLSGINMRVQIAPAALSVTYNGPGSAEMDVRQETLTLTVFDGERLRYRFPFSIYSTVEDVAEGLNRIEGVTATVPEGVSSGIGADRIVGFNNPADLGEEPVYVNAQVASGDGVYASIDEVRAALDPLENMRLQSVGEAEQQEYIIRVEDPGTDKDFNETMTARIEELLGSRFGSEEIIVKQSDYVGPRFSRNLGSQVIYLTALAMALILAYVWFRFKLPYAVSSIVALAHDVTIMLGFIGALQLEISTATIAAVLTIIGYSLNDTIVIFDRVRENAAIVKDSDFKTVVDTSITQSLSRTLITSLTTLLAVSAIYIFGAGAIKEFALNLIVGVIIGTYSSMFVASPVLSGWINSRNRRRKIKEAEKYGGKIPESVKEKKQQPAASSKEEKPAADKPAGTPPAAPKKPIERKERGKKRSKKKKKKK
jgi:preprotein translocase subunit SecF